jgi:hypothetical protein
LPSAEISFSIRVVANQVVQQILDDLADSLTFAAEHVAAMNPRCLPRN